MRRNKRRSLHEVLKQKQTKACIRQISKQIQSLSCINCPYNYGIWPMWIFIYFFLRASCTSITAVNRIKRDNNGTANVELRAAIPKPFRFFQKFGAMEEYSVTSEDLDKFMTAALRYDIVVGGRRPKTQELHELLFLLFNKFKIPQGPFTFTVTCCRKVSMQSTAADCRTCERAYR